MRQKPGVLATGGLPSVYTLQPLGDCVSNDCDVIEERAVRIAFPYLSCDPLIQMPYMEILRGDNSTSKKGFWNGKSLRMQRREGHRLRT